MSSDLWLLPEGFSDILPGDAWRIERKRQQLLHTLHLAGYELVMPPMAEYLDSLLTGTGTNLEIDTFKISDRISGRMLGVRADFTPQVSRIDAHILNREGPVRLCYAGRCLRTDSEVLQSREPIIIGAELFGAEGADADWEIISLMIECLTNAGVTEFDVSLGHVGIIAEVARQFEICVDDHLLDILHRKDRDGLNALAFKADAEAAFTTIMGLIGGKCVLEQARKAFGNNAAITAIVNALEAQANTLRTQYPDIPVHFDFSEARGYSYHNGIVFNALHRSTLSELGRGGRYDNVGKYFGRERSATGFSLSLMEVDRAVGSAKQGETKGNNGVIIAPHCEDEALDAAVHRLRQSGQRVIRLLKGEEQPNLLRVSGRLVEDGNTWKVVNA